MLTLDAIQAAGYTEHKSPKDGTRLFSKWAMLESGRLYCVHFYYWHTPLGHRDNFSAEVRLYLNGEDDFDIVLPIRKPWTVTQVEEFFRLAYERLTCVPDPHNNG